MAGQCYCGLFDDQAAADEAAAHYQAAQYHVSLAQYDAGVVQSNLDGSNSQKRGLSVWMVVATLGDAVPGLAKPAQGGNPAGAKTKPAVKPKVQPGKKPTGK